MVMILFLPMIEVVAIGFRWYNQVVVQHVLSEGDDEQVLT